jgi:hypothetical protein
MTVAPAHPIKMQALVHVVRTLQCAVQHLVFVVPDEHFDSFREQVYHTQDGKVVDRFAAEIKAVVQWVLGLSLAQ